MKEGIHQAKKTLVTIAHKIQIAVHHILKQGTPYKEPELKYQATK